MYGINYGINTLVRDKIYLEENHRKWQKHLEIKIFHGINIPRVWDKNGINTPQIIIPKISHNYETSA